MARFWFDETYAGRIKQWDFQWTFSGWLRDAVSVTPRVNLVTNIGHGSDATHMRDDSHPFAAVPVEAMPFPLRHPQDVAVLEEADRMVWDTVFPRFQRFRRRRLWRPVSRLTDQARAVLTRDRAW
jgi:hypothetical protein